MRDTSATSTSQNRATVGGMELNDLVAYLIYSFDSTARRPRRRSRYLKLADQILTVVREHETSQDPPPQPTPVVTR